MISFKQYLSDSVSALEASTATDMRGDSIDHDEAMTRWRDLSLRLRGRRGAVFFIGNGASATIASHMASDSLMNAGLRSFSFDNTALLTALSNDIEFEKSYSVPLSRLGTRGDILVAISSSGNSPNILAAVNEARRMGLTIITLTGKSPENQLRKLGDINFHVPADPYGIVESSHGMMLHCWLDMCIEEIENREQRKRVLANMLQTHNSTFQIKVIRDEKERESLIIDAENSEEIETEIFEPPY